MRRASALGVLVACLLVSGCGSRKADTAPDPRGARSITVTSPAFADGHAIPAEHTCKGAGTPPPLEWSGATDTAGSLALVVDDPDAPHGDYIHWIVLGIPAGRGGTDGGVPDGAHDVEASGGPGWTPPCPPSGTHHYRFTVYAFPPGGTSSLGGKASPLDVVAWIADNAVAWGRLTGTVSAK